MSSELKLNLDAEPFYPKTKHNAFKQQESKPIFKYNAKPYIPTNKNIKSKDKLNQAIQDK